MLGGSEDPSSFDRQERLKGRWAMAEPLQQNDGSWDQADHWAVFPQVEVADGIPFESQAIAL